MGAIAVVDYGMGNLRSVAKALERVAGGQTVRVTQSAAGLADAERVVFPGVGAIRDCVQEIDRLGLREPLLAAARSKPFLGICLGMQALLEESEENGGTAGLGLIPGVVPRFPAPLTDAAGRKLKVPHMGWNGVRQTVPHPLWAGIAQEARFYFVHSYHVQPDDPSWITASTDYGGAFVSAIGRGALFAVQFHPEKSQADGLRLLHNFCHWKP